MPELVWLELARTDLLGIVDYISDDNPDAAQRVKDDIEMKAKKLSEFPKIGARAKLKAPLNSSPGRTISSCIMKMP